MSIELRFVVFSFMNDNQPRMNDNLTAMNDNQPRMNDNLPAMNDNLTRMNDELMRMNDNLTAMNDEQPRMNDNRTKFATKLLYSCFQIAISCCKSQKRVEYLRQSTRIRNNSLPLHRI